MLSDLSLYFFFFFNDTATTEIYTLSLHDALPISQNHARLSWYISQADALVLPSVEDGFGLVQRSEEHTSELQSRLHLVCRLLLEKKKKHKNNITLQMLTKATIAEQYITEYHFT